jgi:hypothetical protein
VEPAYYSPKGPFLSEALDFTDSVRFSKFERFEQLMRVDGKRFGRFSRMGEYPISTIEFQSTMSSLGRAKQSDGLIQHA